MVIYDPASRRVLSELTLFLTPAEASELADSARSLAVHPQKHHHHISNFSAQTEVTIAVYTPENLHLFDAESKALLRAVMPGGTALQVKPTV